MLKLLREYINDENMLVKEYSKDGVTVFHTVATPADAVTEELMETKMPTTDERLTNIENTLDLLLLKQEGII
jgi:hypothetical protein